MTQHQAQPAQATNENENEVISSQTYAMPIATGDLYTITVEVSETPFRTKFRMSDSDGIVTAWTPFYDGVLRLDGKFGPVGLLTSYLAHDAEEAERPFLMRFGF
jgi:hypothetical protein